LAVIVPISILCVTLASNIAPKYFTRFTKGFRVTLQLMVSQSVSQSINQSICLGRRAPSGSHDQILVVVQTWGVLPVERTGLSCNRSQSFPISSDISICAFWFILF